MLNNVVYIDTETTGLDPVENEILEIAIVNDQGDILLDSLVRPVRNTTWEQAQKIHGISPHDVAKAPTLKELGDTIWRSVLDRDVVMYNAKFDTGFLGELLNETKSIQCCMQTFAKVYGVWDIKRDSYKWQRLSMASDFVGYDWSGLAHRALADALACGSVWRYVQNLERLEQTMWERDGAVAIAA